MPVGERVIINAILINYTVKWQIPKSILLLIDKEKL